MPNEIKSFDGREALDEFLKAALPRANFVTRTSDSLRRRKSYQVMILLNIITAQFELSNEYAFQ